MFYYFGFSLRNMLVFVLVLVLVLVLVSSSYYCLKFCASSCANIIVCTTNDPNLAKIEQGREGVFRVQVEPGGGIGISVAKRTFVTSVCIYHVQLTTILSVIDVFSHILIFYLKYVKNSVIKTLYTLILKIYRK